MKKVIAILMALALCLSMTTVFAAELNWADVEPTVNEQGWAGQFWTLNGVPLQLWVPDACAYIEIDEEAAGEGYIAYWMTEDEAFQIGVQAYQLENAESTLADVAALLTDAGITGIEEGTVNGIPVLAYSWENDDGVKSNVVSYLFDGGIVVEFAFTAGADEGYDVIGAVIAASIQAAE